MNKPNKLQSLGMIVAALAVGFFVFSHPVYAQELEITCGGMSCTTTPAGKKLFLETNIYPGWSTNNVLRITNNYSENRIAMFKIVSANTSDVLRDAILLSVRESASGNVIHEPKTLAEFHDAGYSLLSAVGTNGAYKDYDFYVEMADVGDEYQGKTTSFDLTVGFDTAEVTVEVGSDDDDDADSRGRAGRGGSTVRSTVAVRAPETAGESVFRYLIEDVEDEPPLLEEEIPPVETEPIGEVAGVSSSTCEDPWWWWLLFVLQGLVHFAVYKLIPRPLGYVVQFLVGGVFVYIFVRNFCPWWDGIASYGIGFIGMLLILRKP